MLREYLGNDDMPYLGDLARTTSIMLVNTHYSLNGVRPNTPAVIEVGGLHIREPKKLDSVSRDRRKKKKNKNCVKYSFIFLDTPQ